MFFGAQRHVTPKWPIRSSQNSNSSEILWMSWLPASLTKIRTIMNMLAWRHHFPINIHHFSINILDFIPSYYVLYFFQRHSNLVMLFCTILLYEIHLKSDNKSVIFTPWWNLFCTKIRGWGISGAKNVISWHKKEYIDTISLCYECSSLSKSTKLAKALLLILWSFGITGFPWKWPYGIMKRPKMCIL